MIACQEQRQIHSIGLKYHQIQPIPVEIKLKQKRKSSVLTDHHRHYVHDTNPPWIHLHSRRRWWSILSSTIHRSRRHLTLNLSITTICLSFGPDAVKKADTVMRNDYMDGDRDDGVMTQKAIIRSIPAFENSASSSSRTDLHSSHRSNPLHLH